MSDLDAALAKVVANKPTPLRKWVRDNIQWINDKRKADMPWQVIADTAISLGVRDANGGEPTRNSLCEAFYAVTKERRRKRAAPRVGRPARRKHSSEAFG